MKKILMYMVYVCTTFVTVQVYSQMSLTGEIRPRFEYRHGYQAPLDSAVKGSAFVSQRTRLNFGYSSEKLKFAASLQDVRVWGNQSQLISGDTIAQTFMHEAWASYRLNTVFSIKAGRQELNYDDQRLLGSVNWQQQGRVHDAAVVMFDDTSKKFSVHFGIAYNQNAAYNSVKSYTVTNNYKQMQYFRLNKKLCSFSTSMIFINTGSQSPVSSEYTRYMQTAGPFVEYKKNSFFINAKFYYQTGYINNSASTAKRKVQAYMAGADLSYTFKKKIVMGLGFEHLSGQSQTDTSKAYKDVNHAFNSLYGTGHKFNGYMDYYYAGSAHGNVGLTDIYFKIKYKTEKWYLGIDAHRFMAAADILDVKKTADSGNITAMNPNLGTEIDFEFGYSFSKLFGVQAGYSTYLLKSATSVIKGIYNYLGDGETGNTANWSYLMLIFKPDFLK